MPNNKKHHCVPRFYLKRFSKNGKSIGLYNFSTELKVAAANLYNQCCKDYFYGKEKIVENALGDIEGQTSILFSMIDEIGCLPPPGSPEHLSMILYILTQYGRTKYSADALDEMHDEMFKHIWREKIESELEGVNLDDFTIGIKDVSQFVLGMTAQNYPLLLDLGYKLLVNRTDVEFVTSDHPVIMYNQLLSFRKIGSNTGIATKGLQIFFPISPEKVIVLYDSDVYRVGSDRKIVIEIEEHKDIYNINTLQACSCYENIYFRNENLNVHALHRRVKPYMRTRKTGMKVFPQNDNQYQKSEIIMNFREDIQTNLSLSFMTIRKSAKEWRSSFQRLRLQPAAVVRDQKMRDDHKEFIDRVEEGTYSVSDFFVFLDEKYGKG